MTKFVGVAAAALLGVMTVSAQSKVAVVSMQAALLQTAELKKAQAEVNSLTAAQRAGIAAAEKLGKSTDEISTAFGLSEGALKLFNDASASIQIDQGDSEIPIPLRAATANWRKYLRRKSGRSGSAVSSKNTRQNCSRARRISLGSVTFSS